MKRYMLFAVALVLTLTLGTASAARVIQLGHIDANIMEDPYYLCAYRFGENLKELSGGEFEIDIIGDAQLGSEAAMLEGMSIETIDAAIIFLFCNTFIPVNPQLHIVVGELGHTLLVNQPIENKNAYDSQTKEAKAQTLMPQHCTGYPLMPFLHLCVQSASIPETTGTFPIYGKKQNRHNGHRHSQRHDKRHANADRHVVEQLSCQSAQKHQGNENRTGGKHRTEHRSEHLTRGKTHCVFQRQTTFPFLHNIIGHDNGIIHNHAHSENKSGNGYDVERYVCQAE